jgi:hypothetical protein
MALHNKANDNRPHGLRDEPARAGELLEHARSLAMQIERLLDDLGHQIDSPDSFKVRLARAHTLGLLDQLSELAGPRTSRSGLWKT